MSRGFMAGCIAAPGACSLTAVTRQPLNSKATLDKYLNYVKYIPIPTPGIFGVVDYSIFINYLFQSQLDAAAANSKWFSYFGDAQNGFTYAQWKFQARER